jgi:exopolysaccharide biosynthesis polyprenyl glycosylphosphotransferase
MFFSPVWSYTMNKKIQLFKYLATDFISCIAGWSFFYFYWKDFLEKKGIDVFPLQEFEKLYVIGLNAFPLFWLFIFFFSGYYHDVVRKSRLAEIWQTFGNILFGTTLLFLIFIINNSAVLLIKTPLSVYFTLFFFQFMTTYIPRLVITTIATHKVHTGEIGYNTLLIGSSSKALEAWDEIANQKRSSGNKFIGFVSINNGNHGTLGKYLPCLGKIDDIHNIIVERNVQEVIIAIEHNEHDMFHQIINRLIDVDVEIKAIPSLYDILTGRVRMNSILGIPLISVSHNPMPLWQQKTKTFLDYFIAVTALIISLPISILMVLGIKLTSRGPVFYSHERIGKYGKPFRIYKFRSMFVNAEKSGPELSSRTDDRITPFGKFMRRSRFDEIPNFFNVLRGDMSLVGPRPERKFYINQITRTAPHYLHLLKVKPGITSWGQVKFGYAETVDQMIQRLKYDLLYLDNMSLIVDFKIIIYTILTIIKRKGI